MWCLLICYPSDSQLNAGRIIFQGHLKKWLVIYSYFQFGLKKGSTCSSVKRCYLSEHTPMLLWCSAPPNPYCGLAESVVNCDTLRPMQFAPRTGLASGDTEHSEGRHGKASWMGILAADEHPELMGLAKLQSSTVHIHGRNEVNGKVAVSLMHILQSCSQRWREWIQCFRLWHKLWVCANLNALLQTGEGMSNADHWKIMSQCTSG